MNTGLKTLLFTSLLAGAVGVQAQAPAPPPDASSPDAASSPHQRATTQDATKEAAPNASPEAASASSPHQHDAAAMKPSNATLKMAMQDGAVPATFVKKAALDGMTEVELGKVALTKSQDAKVRSFAERMVKDHGKAGEQLATLAKSKGLDAPTSLDAEHQSMVQTLSSKSGAAFDAAYGEHMNADHSKAIALFEGASKGSDAELAAFAKKTLPTLKEHKQLAQGLAGARTADASDGKASRE